MAFHFPTDHDFPRISKFLLLLFTTIIALNTAAFDYNELQQQAGQVGSEIARTGGRIAGQVSRGAEAMAGGIRSGYQNAQRELFNTNDPNQQNNGYNQQNMANPGYNNNPNGNRNNNYPYSLGQSTRQANITNPLNPPNPNNPFNPYPIPNHNTGSSGVHVEVQLRSYANPGFQLDSQHLCACPPQGDARKHCVDISPTKDGFRCLVSFMVIISSADSSVQYRATPYIPLNQYGQISPEYQSQFQEMFRFDLENQPMAIDVFVHNLGAVINAQNGNIEGTNTVTHVDTFVKPLNETTSGAGSGSSSASMWSSGMSGQQQQQQTQLQGTMLGTQLSLTYSVTCRSKLIGPGCDLSCNTSEVNSALAICQSQKTGYFSHCRWVGGKSQVSDCKNCPWGIKENAYCRDVNGGVLEANHAGVVSTDFRTATIVLSVVCGLLLICLLGCLVLNLTTGLKNRRSSRSSSHRHAGASDTSPLTTSPPILFHNPDKPAPPPYSSGNRPGAVNIVGGPSAAPRSNASTASAASSNGRATTTAPVRVHAPPTVIAKPNKPSLRAPIYQPLPAMTSLSGGGALNESFASSYAGSQAPPLAPSVSADV